MQYASRELVKISDQKFELLGLKGYIAANSDLLKQTESSK